MTDKAGKLLGVLQGIVENRPWYDVKENFRQEERPAQFTSLPEEYRKDERIVKAIEALGISPDKIYTSQAAALDWAAIGVSPFMTTETASGKSFVFQIAALKKMLENPDARILVLYPTRALNSDQLISWQKMMEAAGLPENMVGLLDGGIRYEDRMEVVKNSRILIATPDIIHAWMLADPQIQDPVIHDFLKNIRLRVIDETHVNDGVFGTKFSYLMRRITVLQRLLNPGVSTGKYWQEYGQVIAASATISEADKFLHELTGLPTDQQICVIEPSEDGSPRKPRQIVRVATSNKRINMLLKSFLGRVAQMDAKAKSIIFVDSRKLAETISRELNEMMGSKFSASYKSGYTREVRSRIEENFRDPESELKTLVATSAAEVGINMLPVQIVVNAGIPEHQESLLQRAGRIRQGGLVLVIERTDRDLDVGKHQVEKAFINKTKRPRLYRGNEGIQAQMLACLLAEIQGVTGRKATEADLKLSSWPGSFKEMARDVLAGTRTVADILHRKVPNSTKVQKYFSLRDADGGRARVIIFAPRLRQNITLETLSHFQALNEAYPGASMLHRGDYYKVKKWNDNNPSGEIIIHAELCDKNRLTRAFTKSSLSTNLYYHPHHTGVQTEVMKVGDLNKGDFIANVGFVVRTSVNGFMEFEGYISDTTRGGVVYYNKSDQLDDGNPWKNLEAPKVYRSWHKGILIRVQEGWFHKESRQILGNAIIEAYANKNKLSQKDFSLYVDDIEAKYSPEYGYNIEQGNMMAICESSSSDFGLAKKTG